MKIFVTQGHEAGIGLEVFFKSILLLSKNDLDRLVLIGFKKSIEKTLLTLNIPFEFKNDSLIFATAQLQCQWLTKIDYSESFSALRVGMDSVQKNDILYTLPTAKDQFQKHPGHTEFFRSHYKNPNLGMFFSSNELNLLLLSDHVAISNLSDELTQEVITNRLKLAVDSLLKWRWPISSIFVSGLNPHAGEGGRIGTEDKRVETSLKQLQSLYKFPFSGPYPADTMLIEKKSRHDLLVYLFHDQGLGIFKATQGFIGSNITLGLPFLRFSPDHGTSFKLYGKNSADYRGCFYSLSEALAVLKRNGRGKDSSY